MHDSQHILALVDESDKKLYADSAYRSAAIDASLPVTVENNILEKGYKNHPLTEELVGIRLFDKYFICVLKIFKFVIVSYTKFSE